MKKSTESASLSLAIAASVPDQLAILNEKIASLKKINESVYKTKKSFDSFNLETETEVARLIMMFSAVQARAKAYYEAQSSLGIASAPVFRIEGSTEEEWKEDILLRIQIIQQKDTYNELTALKKEWEELLDKEDRKAILAEKMKKVLS